MGESGREYSGRCGEPEGPINKRSPNFEICSQQRQTYANQHQLSSSVMCTSAVWRRRRWKRANTVCQIDVEVIVPRWGNRRWPHPPPTTHLHSPTHIPTHPPSTHPHPPARTDLGRIDVEAIVQLLVQHERKAIRVPCTHRPKVGAVN